MALPLMLVGEKAEIHADARFAYGTLGLKNEEDPKISIPPTSKVCIVRIKVERKSNYIVFLPQVIYELELLECTEEPEIEDQTYEKRKETG